MLHLGPLLHLGPIVVTFWTFVSFRTSCYICAFNKTTDNVNTTAYNVEAFKKIRDSLSVSDGCLFYGPRVVISASLQTKVLEILHLGDFDMKRMKQLARTAVYWPGIDARIVDVSRACQTCAEHQNKPSKPPIHPWMFAERPWGCLHLDHAINFLGSNCLVLTDVYSNYPCIHPLAQHLPSYNRLTGTSLCTLWISAHSSYG